MISSVHYPRPSYLSPADSSLLLLENILLDLKQALQQEQGNEGFLAILKKLPEELSAKFVEAGSFVSALFSLVTERKGSRLSEIFQAVWKDPRTQPFITDEIILLCKGLPLFLPTSEPFPVSPTSTTPSWNVKYRSLLHDMNWNSEYVGQLVSKLQEKDPKNVALYDVLTQEALSPAISPTSATPNGE